MSKKLTPDGFWRRVESSNKPGECWNWSGAVNSTGYGTLSYRGVTTTAHRTAAFLSGLVPSLAAPRDRKGGGFILHRCDNRRCCNPAHMRVGTYAENQSEAYARGRRRANRGAAHPNAKQTPESVALIFDMYAHGVSQEAIARLLGVAQSGVSKILLGSSYA